MTKTEMEFQANMFETQKQWLQEEYTKAKHEKPKNAAKIYELENRVKSFRKEVDKFNELKKQQGL